MLPIIQNLNIFFEEKTKNLTNYSNQTKAYITHMFSSKHNIIYPHDSLTIIYAEAKSKQRFDLYQNVADWILFIKTFYPENLQNASQEYYNTLAQDSYYKCYKLIKWELFQEISDKFPELINSLQLTFRVNSSEERLNRRSFF